MCIIEMPKWKETLYWWWKNFQGGELIQRENEEFQESFVLKLK